MPVLTSFVAGAPFWDCIDEGYEENLGAIQNPWDILILDGIRVPGVVESISVVPKMRIHIGKSSGEDGGPVVERGHEAARVDISQKIWTPAQWLAWQALKVKIWRGPGQKPRTRDGTKGKKNTGAVTIVHPACAECKVFAIIFETIQSAEPGKEVGARIVKMKAVQYIPGGKKAAPATVPYSVQGVDPAGKKVQAGTPPNTPSQQPVLARDRP